MSRLLAAACSGVAVSIVGFKFLYKQQTTKHAAAESDPRKSAIYRRFKKFATLHEENTTETKKASAAASGGGGGGGGDEPVMTISDFISSLTSTKALDAKAKRHNEALFKDPQVKPLVDRLVELVDDDKSGTIDFNEYITLQTLLALPIEDLRGALEMFDRPGQHRVTFPQFRALLRALSDGRVGSSPAGGGGESATPPGASESSSLSRHFFGNNMKQSVSFDDFLGRLSEIRSLVRTIEFNCAATNTPQDKERATLCAVRSRLMGNPLCFKIEGSATHKSSHAADSLSQSLDNLRQIQDQEHEDCPSKNTGVGISKDNNNKQQTQEGKSAVVKYPEHIPVVKKDDYMVIMALLALSENWTSGLNLFLRKEDNVINHEMLARVLRDVDLSSVVPSSTGGVVVKNVPLSQNFTGTKSNKQVFCSKEQADMFCQLIDEDHDGTICVKEVEKIAKAHNAFFSAFVPSFQQGAPRNFVQQWSYCMQQK